MIGARRERQGAGAHCWIAWDVRDNFQRARAARGHAGAHSHCCRSGCRSHTPARRARGRLREGRCNARAGTQPHICSAYRDRRFLRRCTALGERSCRPRRRQRHPVRRCRSRRHPQRLLLGRRIRCCRQHRRQRCRRHRQANRPLQQCSLLILRLMTLRFPRNRSRHRGRRTSSRRRRHPRPPSSRRPPPSLFDATNVSGS